jgi:hypothetical protein
MRNIGMLLWRRAAPTRVAATANVIVGLATLTGWALGVEALTGVIPKSVGLEASTAERGRRRHRLLLLVNRAPTRLDRFGQILSAAT